MKGRRVSPNGCLSFKRKVLFIGEALQGQKVGLEEIEDGIWSFYFGPVLVGRYKLMTYPVPSPNLHS